MAGSSERERPLVGANHVGAAVEDVDDVDVRVDLAGDEAAEGAQVGVLAGPRNRSAAPWSRSNLLGRHLLAVGVATRTPAGREPCGGRHRSGRGHQWKRPPWSTAQATVSVGISGRNGDVAAIPGSTGVLLRVLTGSPGFLSCGEDRNACGIVSADRSVTQNDGRSVKRWFSDSGVTGLTMLGMCLERRSALSSPCAVAVRRSMPKRGSGPERHSDRPGEGGSAKRLVYSAPRCGPRRNPSTSAPHEIQDGVVVPSTPEYPVPRQHGRERGAQRCSARCTVEDGAPDRDGRHRAQRSGGRSRVAGGCRSAGPAGVVIPPRSLVAGSRPGPPWELSDAELAANRHNAAVYEHLIELHREASEDGW